MQINGIDYYQEPGENFALSRQLFLQEMSETASLSNLEFFIIGQLRTSTVIGYPVTQDIQIVGLDWQNTSGVVGKLNIFSAAKGTTGVVVGYIDVGADQQGYTASSINIPAGNFMSFQWIGSTISNIVFVIKYRLKVTI